MPQDLSLDQAPRHLQSNAPSRPPENQTTSDGRHMEIGHTQQGQSLTDGHQQSQVDLAHHLPPATPEVETSQQDQPMLSATARAFFVPLREEDYERAEALAQQFGPAKAYALALRERDNDFAAVLAEQLGPDEINKPDEFGNTPLIYAVEHNLYFEYVEILLDKLDATAINQANRKGETALLRAVQHDRPRIVEMLIGRLDDAAINQMNRLGETALRRALRLYHAECFQILEDHLPPGTLKEETSQQDIAMIPATAEAFEVALGSGNYKVAEALAKQLGPDEINKPDKSGNTPLMLAILEDREAYARLTITEDSESEYSEACFRILIDKLDATALTQVNQRGDTPLLLASSSRNDAFFRILIDKLDATALTQVNRHGHTPLLRAIEFNHPRIVEILASKLDATALNASALNSPALDAPALGAKAFHTAGMYTTRDLSAEIFFDPWKPRWNETPLLKAIRHRHDGCAAALVDKLDATVINHVDAQGRTPLILAAISGLPRSVEILANKLDAAAINHADQHGKTALMYAIESDWAYLTDCAEILISQLATKTFNQADQ